MTKSFICPESATCSMQAACSNLMTLEVHNQFVLWQIDFANTMIKHYHDNGVPYRIYRNCVHPDWQTMKSNQGVKVSLAPDQALLPYALETEKSSKLKRIIKEVFQ